MAKRAVRRGRRSKYGAIPTKVDGIRFASKREAKRYGELKLLERAGRIYKLELQPRYELTAPVRPCGHDVEYSEIIGSYVGDFRYAVKEIDDGGFSGRWRWVIEDVKGFKTPLYRWKKKHVEAQYGITITEV